MKEVLRSIDDVSLFPVVAILIFFTFFIGLLIYVIGLKKNEVADMAAIPIREEHSQACVTKQMLINQAKSLN